MDLPQLASVIEPEKLQLILVMSANGEHIREIAARVGLQPYALMQYLQANPAFGAQYERAREMGMDLWAEDLLTIHEDIIDTPRAKLASDNIKWLLSRRSPQKYSDRMVIDNNVNISIDSALRDARQRVNTADIVVTRSVATQVATGCSMQVLEYINEVRHSESDTQSLQPHNTVLEVKPRDPESQEEEDDFFS